ncbi:MAG: HAD family hydrolase [Acetobacteraceae bacterium]|nr:HAD family hydrolase [Acetobacteraceae bacterium]
MGQGVRTVLEALLLDLDGTLLDIDFQAFLRDYLARLGRHFASRYPPDRFCGWVMASTRAMIDDRDPARTNRDAFWQDFAPRAGCPVEELLPGFEAFYREVFPRLCVYGRAVPAARPLVERALARGLKVAVATNPVFPLMAIQERLRWAGLADLPFALVTAYEDMHFCKPHPEYYLETASRLGVEPRRCLMVGDRPWDDMSAALAGMRTYLVEREARGEAWGAGGGAGEHGSGAEAAGEEGPERLPVPDHRGPLEGVLGLVG